MTPTPLVTASWVRDTGRRWVLVDAAGSPRGTLDRPGPTLGTAEAMVDGVPVALRSGGFLRRHVEAQAHDGRRVRAEVGAVRWRGTVSLGDGRVVPIARSLGVPVRFTIGDPPAPLLVVKARRRELGLTFTPAVATQDPALLPLLVLLWLQHERSTAQGG